MDHFTKQALKVTIITSVGNKFLDNIGGYRIRKGGGGCSRLHVVSMNDKLSCWLIEPNMFLVQPMSLSL